MTNDRIWPGILIRADIDDTGTIPRTPLANSPDIPISGAQPLEDPGILTDPESYDQVYDYDVEAGFPTYAYMRGKNMADRRIDGEWNLFYAAPNILLYPSLWQQNQLANGTGDLNPPFSIEPGGVAATLDAFNWVMPVELDQCSMIGKAVTPEHGNPFNGVTALNDLVRVLAENGNVAQFNVGIVRGDVPDITSSVHYEQGSEAARVDIVTIFKNIPKGSSYSIAASTPLNGRTLSASGADTQENTFKIAWVDLDIPALWAATFNYELTFGSDWSGIPDGARPQVEIRAELVMQSDHPLYALGADPDLDVASGTLRTGADGWALHIVVAGGFRTVCADMGP